VRPCFLALAPMLVSACVGEPECIPVGGGPYWIEEGQPISFTVTCEDGSDLDAERLAVAPLPPGATWDPATATFSWTPGLDQAAVVRIVLTLGELAGTVTIGVADAFDAAGNVPVVDPSRYPLELGLPVLFISPAPQGTTAEPVTVIYRGETYAAEGELRGAASLGYPKNSYDLQFSNNNPFFEPDHGGEGGMTRRRIVLISTFDDNSQVRQRLAYDVWNAMDPEHIQIQTFSAVVYLDGIYHGLFTVADHVDADLMAIHGLAADGNLYKAYNHDANFRLTDYDGNPKSTLHQGYEKKEGEPPGDFADLDGLVQWAATIDVAGFESGRAARLDTRDYDDWWIFATATLADDSAGKNSYHHRDPAGGPWRFAPWDLNHSFGQTWETEREAADTRDDYIDNNRLFELTLASPTLQPQLYARYQTLRQGPLHPDSTLALVDTYVAEIDASARRDQRRWSTEYRTYSGWSWRTNFTTYDEELAYLRTWLADRWTFLESTY